MSHPLVLLPFDEVFPKDQIRHHFVGQDDQMGLYAKEVHIRKGTVLVSHEHAYDHLSILASGTVQLTVRGLTNTWRGPTAVTIDKGTPHSLFALTDTVWFCIHPTQETDPTRVDDIILSKEV